MLLKPTVLAALAAGLLSGAATRADDAPAKPRYEPREHYTKFEYRIPARDGKLLFAAVYVPKDAGQGGKTYPMLMTRTPYGCGPYGVDRADGARHLAPNEDFLKAGYIFVCQDVRGRFQSEGEFVEMTPHKDAKKSPADVDESSDTYDTVQWLITHVAGNNGRVGLWGISYPGFYTAASIIDSHPAIKAASPQAPIADLFKGDDSYHGGAFMLAANFGFYTFFKPQQTPTAGPKRWSEFDYGTPDGYEYFLQAGNLDALSGLLAKGGAANPYFDVQLQHDRYDEFWKPRGLTPHLKNIRAAVLTVGGWFDAEDLAGPLAIHRAIAAQSPGTDNRLVMGPWSHGGWVGGPGRSLGRVKFDQPTSEQFQKQVLLPFFEQHLRGAADAKAGKPESKPEPIAKATVFETGTNVWRRYDAWPPAQAKPRTLYFAAGGRLSFTPPTAAEPAFDSWVSDPNKPVPFVAYTAQGMPREYMVSDQRFASSRPDVLTYRSEVLQEDVTVAGPIVARLFASTSGTDADWVVKLIDVYPSELDEDAAKRKRGEDPELPEAPLAGYQQLVRGDPLRGRFRHSLEQPEAMVPGQVEELKVELQDVNHSFRRGHRIMVQLQSSWFPLIDRNPQRFVPIHSARPEDFQAATQKLYRWQGQASGLELRVLPTAH
ncbi:MAG: X-Pro dipeptidyl-peptidase [Roseateles depolymerans]|uniref:X-Pro dipeptidyl-peptidase n=1 Tax=Roseateles depolymerans TaxID=76731 RepID=A0A2W5DZ88_9BURK|nr:MAG: X-Pro dipeptidyl-peptidase [Roseateles depolymerans]